MKFDMQYFLTAKYAKWIIIGLLSVFSLLIAKEFFQYAFMSVRAPKAVVIAPDSSKRDTTAYILHSAIFGVYVPKDLNDASIKKSMLDLTLVGILYANKPADSHVILRSANGSEKTYKIGDPVPGGAKIERITATGVVVEHNGGLESLSLPKNELLFETAPKPLQEDETP